MIKWVAAFVGALAVLVFVVVVSGPEAEGITISGYFVDDDGHLFEADIDAIAAADVTRGCNPPTNNRFCPDDRVTRGQMAALLRRALELPGSGTDYFTDASGTFANDINALAAADIARGCNPPANTRFCPDDFVTREQMAAFLVRGLDLTANTHSGFIDVSSSNTFVQDIGRLATAGITRGCNPPSNNRYCPRDHVTRGQMAAFLNRALGLPSVVLRIPVGHHNSMNCSKDGERCSLTVDLSAGRTYRVQEGLFVVNPATSAEQSQFNSSSTSFALSMNGSDLSLNPLSQQTSGGVTTRDWRRDMTFSPGTHTLIGRWRWDGGLVQTSTITVRASN